MKTLLFAVALAAFAPVRVQTVSVPVGELRMVRGSAVPGVVLQSDIGASLQGSSPDLR